MKLLLLPLLLLRTNSSLAYPTVKTWTFHELNRATGKNVCSPDKVLIKAFNQMSTLALTGKYSYITSLLLSPSGNVDWTKSELELSLRNAHTSADYTPYIAKAYVNLNDFNSDSFLKNKLDTVKVHIDAIDVSRWKKEDMNRALMDRSLNPDLVPYINDALLIMDRKTGKANRVKGVVKINEGTAYLITPVGLIPGNNRPIIVPCSITDFHHK